LADALHQWLTLKEKPPRAEVGYQNSTHLVTNALSMRQLLGYFSILIAFFAVLVGLLSIWAASRAPDRDGSLFFIDNAWRFGIVAGVMAVLGIYAVRSRMRVNRSGPRPARPVDSTYDS
jgi:hypothetical protein